MEVEEGSDPLHDQPWLWTCMAGAHLQYVSNHYAKFEFKGGVDVIMSTFNTLKHIIKCAQNIGYTFMFNV